MEEMEGEGEEGEEGEEEGMVCTLLPLPEIFRMTGKDGRKSMPQRCHTKSTKNFPQRFKIIEISLAKILSPQGDNFTLSTSNTLIRPMPLLETVDIELNILYSDILDSGVCAAWGIDAELPIMLRFR